jgi:hypothetical protein
VAALDVSDRYDRAARNQDRFRKYNEDLQPANAAHVWVDPPMPDWVCECANALCSQPVQLSMAEYESVRSDATHFFVAPSREHVVSDVERVVERTDRYWVVEKLGPAGDASEELDDRTDS